MDGKQYGCLLSGPAQSKPVLYRGQLHEEIRPLSATADDVGYLSKATSLPLSSLTLQEQSFQLLSLFYLLFTYILLKSQNTLLSWFSSFVSSYFGFSFPKPSQTHLCFRFPSSSRGSITFWLNRYCFLTFFNPHPRTCYYWFEKERGREKERETLLSCLPYAHNWRSNLQPRYVSWPVIEPTTFLVYGTRLPPTKPPSQGTF